MTELSMKKQDMTARELSSRRQFVKILSGAGWDDGGWNLLLEKGANLCPEAVGEYVCDGLQVRLEYHIEQDYLLLGLFEPDGSVILPLRLYLKDNLSELLDRIVGRQTQLNKDNYDDLVEILIPLTRQALIETPNGLVELTP